MSQVGLEVIAINSSTHNKASRLRQEGLWVTVRTHGNIIVAGPEQLKSKEFKKTVLNDIFWACTCGLGFDEVHLLNVWGPQFWKNFLQMGFVKARLHDTHSPWILGSATVRNGSPPNNIKHLLGLCGTLLHIIQRSNYRPEIQLLFRELTSLIDGDLFPELEWVLHSGCSTLIFAKTISLGSHIHGYLYNGQYNFFTYAFTMLCHI
jgi:superfamily II DNA helicase RecQ